MKRTITKLLFLGAFMAVLSGCGTRVYIDTNEVGREYDTSGLSDKILGPGSLRLDICGASACPMLIKLPMNDFSLIYEGNYLMTKSYDQEMNLDLSVVTFVKNDKESLDKAYKLKSEKIAEQVKLIPQQLLADTFLTPIFKDTVRRSLNNYSIEDVIKNPDEVRMYIFNQLRLALKDTPIDIKVLGFHKIGYPEAVTKAKEEYAKIEIDKATKRKAIAAELEMKEETQKLEIARAKIAVAVDKIVAKEMGLTPQEYMTLNAINKSAENGTPWAINTDVIYRGKK